MTHEKTKPSRPMPDLSGCVEISGDFVAFAHRWHVLTAKTPPETGPRKVKKAKR